MYGSPPGPLAIMYDVRHPVSQCSMGLVVVAGTPPISVSLLSPPLTSQQCMARTPACLMVYDCMAGTLGLGVLDSSKPQ